ncbi:uncharacterized protein [Antedon mediterranea]|uniref:uncharacterized protein n=1 Tax=Antedon mediterranea TaxID=105859 RepID=UPI003AF638D9
MGTRSSFLYKLAIGTTASVTLIILIVMSFVYVHPYRKTKDFEPTTCKVKVHDIKIQENKECNCYTTSESSDYETYCDYGDFECLKIFVSFLDSRRRNRTAMLYTTDKQYRSDKECTYPVCDTYDPEHVYVLSGKYVEDQDYLDFRDKYTVPGTNIPCFYNPELGEAIMERLITREDAIASTVATVATGTFIILILLLCLIRST